MLAKLSFDVEARGTATEARSICEMGQASSSSGCGSPGKAWHIVSPQGVMVFFLVFFLWGIGFKTPENNIFKGPFALKSLLPSLPLTPE